MKWVLLKLFANPFGPVQLENKTNKLIDKYFNNLNENKTVIGEIYTKLAVSGFEQEGPKKQLQTY